MSSPADRHAQRRDEARAAERDEQRVSARLSVARVVVALATVGIGLWSFEADAPPGIGWLALAGLVMFVVLVLVHDRIERRAAWHATIAGWHQERIHALARAWAELPAAWLPTVDAHHPFAHDLDLFGSASLFALIGSPGTPVGRERLTQWLLHPARPPEVTARQDATRELASDETFREQVTAHSRTVGRAVTFDVHAFVEWAEGDRWLISRPWLLWSIRALSIATPLLLLAQILGLTTAAWWLATMAIGLAVTWATRHPKDHTLGVATGWEPAIRAYVDWLALIEATPMSAPYLQEAQSALGTDHDRASHRIRRFQRIVAFAELRHNALLHFPVHALTLWDFHVWAALEHWQRDSGSHVWSWLDALARLEALVGLATLAADHPNWSYPVVSETAPALEARAIGHPLLAPSTCVSNDVRVGPPGRVLCITGSNMSGKSTLLRAIGVNAVLAEAGAPVCAATLAMPPLSLHTSLRVVDSLAEGVSFFMAALERLKRLVEAADEASRAGASEPQPIVLYLLDEVLQGTNSTEREAAVRIVLRHLLASSAIGAITTHDLALTSTPELQESGDHVHFRETIHGEGEAFRMTFDYTLRPGVATSRNALALLRQVGLAD